MINISQNSNICEHKRFFCFFFCGQNVPLHTQNDALSAETKSDWSDQQLAHIILY